MKKIILAGFLFGIGFLGQSYRLGITPSEAFNSIKTSKINLISQKEEDLSNDESNINNSDLNNNRTSKTDNKKDNASKIKKLIAIDAGHQITGDLINKEPIAPNSTDMKFRIAPGKQGVSTGQEEYELTLKVSKKLKEELENRGYEVLMIRERNDVDISNVERTTIANEAGADVLLKIHANTHEDSSKSGIMTMCQTENNPYNSSIYNECNLLSKSILENLLAVTKSENGELQETDSLSGLNWSKIPVSIIEMGYISNVKEDILLSQDSYQNKIVQGIADGLDDFFNKTN